jgi:hypothetical protein
MRDAGLDSAPQCAAMEVRKSLTPQKSHAAGTAMLMCVNARHPARGQHGPIVQCPVRRGEFDMNGETASAWIFGVLMAVLCGIGLVMAEAARDSEILVFGISLAAFSAVFNVGLVRRRLMRPAPAVVATATVAEAVTHG